MITLLEVVVFGTRMLVLSMCGGHAVVCGGLGGYFFLACG